MRYIVLVGLIYTLTSCYNPQRNCQDFRTGTFEFEAYLNGDLQKTTFIRTDSIEIEIFNKKRDTAQIRWINDCEYVLQSKNPKSRADKRPIHMKILSTTENSYMFEYKIVGKNEKQKGRVVKVD